MPIQKSQLNILLFCQRDTKTYRRSATCIVPTQTYHQPTGAELALDCRENADADTQVRAPAALVEGKGHC